MKQVVALSSILALLWLAGWLWFAQTISMMNDKQQAATAKDIGRLEKTDAIVVLTGGKNRINAGIDLLYDGASDRLLISGVNGDISMKDITSRWKRERGENKQVPCCITLGYEATNTRQNAQETKSWVIKNGIGSIRLVTSAYHMPRAYAEISNALPDTRILRHPVFSEDMKPWSRKFCKLTFVEYNKIIAVKLHQLLMKVVNKGEKA